jgi:hypothetical protein
MRRSVSLCLVLVALLLALGGLGLLIDRSDSGPAEPESADLFRFEGQESGFWPYVTPRPVVTRHGPTNLVVRADSQDLVWALTRTPGEGAGADAGRPNTTAGSAIEPTPIEWERTTGAPRYMYVFDGESGEWVRETSHVMDGTYYGARQHARLYASPRPDEPWTAVQAHAEHFDWFTLGHVVENVEYAQAHVEADLADDRQSVTVRQVDLHNEDADGDGWASIVTLAILVLPIGIGLSVSGRSGVGAQSVDAESPIALRERCTRPVGALAVALPALVLGVRAGGLLLEATDGLVPIAAIGILLYPAIGIGIPAVTVLLGRHIDRATDAAATATVPLLAGMLLDYAVVDVTAVTLQVIAHRGGLVFALGLVAAGAVTTSRQERRVDWVLAAGLGLWAVVSLVGLFA